jgi:hypothetical protein
LSLALELSLDLPSDADELPTDVDDALEADDVLSASAGGAPSSKVRVIAKGNAIRELDGISLNKEMGCDAHRKIGVV